MREELLWSQLKTTSLTEWLAFAFGVAQVVGARFNLRINFLAGIVSVILYIWVFYQFGLYAEAVLNLYYLFISIAGFFLWSKPGQAAIQRCSAADWQKAGTLFVTAFVLLSMVLHQYTTSTVPYWDALVSSIAWSGSWLLMKRKLENWWVLNLSNVLAVPLFLHKELVLTAALTLIYIVVALNGYFTWKKEIDAR
jgi:nicotinamide mononucleotide transporter